MTYLEPSRGVNSPRLTALRCIWIPPTRTQWLNPVTVVVAPQCLQLFGFGEPLVDIE